MVEFLEDFHGQSGAVLPLAGFDFQEVACLRNSGGNSPRFKFTLMPTPRMTYLTLSQFRAEFP